MTTTTIDFLRHGLPEGEDCFRGHTDFELTDTGLKQMDAAVQGMPIPDHIITSPLNRCVVFAKHYAALNELDFEIAPEFIELDFGDWDGKKKQEIWEQDQSLLSNFWENPWQTTPPNGEPLADFDRRIQHAWNALLKKFQGKRVLVVTHAGVMKQILRIVLAMPKSEHYLQRLNLPYAAKIRVTVFQDENGQSWPQVHWPD